MIKITSEISEIENRRIMKKILKTPNLVYWKHQQNFKNLARLMQKKRERTQSTEPKNERGDVITNLTEIKKIIREYHEQLSTNGIT